MNDYFGKDSITLRNKKLWLFDMDGTIYAEDRLFEGALDLFERIRKEEGMYVFITNNSSKGVCEYIEKVTGLGIAASEKNFYTSTQAAIDYIRGNYPDSLIFCQGTKGFAEELRAAGLRITETVDKDAAVVLVGFDTELTSRKLYDTCRMLQYDNDFIATNPDLRCPTEFGFIPDCGSICAMLANATEREPLYLGKPGATMVEAVRKKLHVSKDATVVIGDRLYTDIASGRNAGVDTIAVLTGEANAESILASEERPTYTFASLRELYRAVFGGEKECS